MSLRVIIIAVIALIILVVLILSFTSKYRVFGKTTSSCEQKGGHCAKTCKDTELINSHTDCVTRAADTDNTKDAGKTKCCIPFGTP